MSFSERSRIKRESASQLLCSQPLSLRASNRSPACLHATLQIYPQRPRQRHTLPSSPAQRAGFCPTEVPGLPFSRKQVSLRLCWGKRIHPRQTARTRRVLSASSPEASPAASPITQDPDLEQRKWAHRDLNTFSLRLKLAIQLLQ